MTIRVYDAFTDEISWNGILKRFPSNIQDIYFRPEYVRLHLFEPGVKALLFTYEQDGELWLHPFLLQPISPIDDTCDKDLFDIETAYGYGGPLSSTDDEVFLKESHEVFLNWARQQGAIAAFIRFHPLVENQRWADSNMEIILKRETASLNLQLMSESIYAFDGKTRNMIRRAERTGVNVIQLTTSENIERFITLYEKTMGRVGADSYYSFGESYFQNLAKLIDNMGWLLAVVENDKWIAASLFLKGNIWLHYHLSATDPENKIPGATNLLLYAAAQLGLNEGMERLHMGGGNTAANDDPLLKFKRSMSSDCHQFFIGKHIIDEDNYKRLRKRWREVYPALAPEFSNRILCYRYRD